MAKKTLPTLSAGIAVTGSDIFLARQGAGTEDVKVTATQLKTFISTGANQQNIVASGTAYTLTATSAFIDFGTVDPAVVLSAAGTYEITYIAQIDLVGATFAANQTLSLKVRRINNTAADLPDSTATITLPVITTGTQTIARIPVTFYYTTANSNDSIAVWGNLSALPSAGSVTVSAANIKVERKQQ